MKIGEYNNLKLLRFTSVGAFLGDDEGNDILLPNKYVPERISVDDEIRVFVYKDSEDRIIATTLEPLLTVNQFASLKAKEVSNIGAFFEWGLEKDLLVPYREQRSEIQHGYWYLVYLGYDEQSDRLFGSTKVDEHVNEDTSSLIPGMEVEVLIGERSELGYQAIINNEFIGLLYNSELFKPIKLGQRHKAWIQQVRPDGKVDLSLQPLGFANIEPSANQLLEIIRDKGGFLSLTDKSEPEEIYMLLQMSKKTFKKALGTLYKQRLVSLEPDGVKLVSAHQA